MKSSALRVALPLLMLGGLALLLWQDQPPSKQPASDAASPALLISEDFANVSAGQLPSGWEAPRGTFGVGKENAQNALIFSPEPMVEGRILLPGLLTGGGTVRARMQGERAKRTFPRFGVGLGETVVYKLLARPGEAQLELVEIEQLEVNGQPVENDKVLASAPWKWLPDQWCWVELSVKPRDQGSHWEGRCWPDNEARPTNPNLTFDAPTPPKLVRATLHVAPYALKPIFINKVETLR